MNIKLAYSMVVIKLVNIFGFGMALNGFGMVLNVLLVGFILLIAIIIWTHFFVDKTGGGLSQIPYCLLMFLIIILMIGGIIFGLISELFN